MKKLILSLLLAVSVMGVQAQQPAHKCQHANCQHQVSCQKAAAAKPQSEKCPANCKESQAKEFESMTVEEFSKFVSAKNVVVVDVRTPKEYAEGHIKGAQNIEWGDTFEATCHKSLNKKKTVAVYCRSGRRSKAAAAALVKMGYKVVELDKGILGWQQAGMLVVK